MEEVELIRFVRKGKTYYYLRDVETKRFIRRVRTVKRVVKIIRNIPIHSRYYAGVIEAYLPPPKKEEEVEDFLEDELENQLSIDIKYDKDEWWFIGVVEKDVHDIPIEEIEEKIGKWVYRFETEEGGEIRSEEDELPN